MMRDALLRVCASAGMCTEVWQIYVEASLSSTSMYPIHAFLHVASASLDARRGLSIYYADNDKRGCFALTK